MTTIPLHESATLTPPTTGTRGRFRARLISTGIGSSGVYPATTLQDAAESGVFSAGTHIYLDHPTETERYERPARSVRDLAGTLTSDAIYVDEDGGALDADIEIYAPWQQIVTQARDAIGLSIRAAAVVDEDDDQGRPIIGRITEVASVDLVTKAGRGGKILSLIESAKTEAQLIEASADQRASELRDLVRAAYATTPHEYAYVLDYDETLHTVTFERESDVEGAPGVYTQAYTVVGDTAAALAGEPIRVRRVVAYVPVTEATTPHASAPTAETSVQATPAGQSTTITSEEDTMPQIEEARLRQLEEAHGRVPALEAERDTAIHRAQEAEARALQAEAGTYAHDFARTLVTQANPELAEASVARIVREALAKPLPLQENGRLDTDALTPTVEEARKAEETYLSQVAEASGLGSVRGVGATSQPAEVTEADIDQAIAAAFGRKEA